MTVLVGSMRVLHANAGQTGYGVLISRPGSYGTGYETGIRLSRNP